MNMIVRGRKSSKGGGSGSESENTLRSSTKVNLIEALGEGPIVGLVNGGNSIYFDDTPLQNVDGTWNFAGVSWDQRTGLPEQAALPGPNSTSTPFTVQVQLKETTPIIRTIDDPQARAVQIVMQFPALANANKDTGDITGTTLQYLIERRSSGGDWVIIENVLLSNQKFTSPYYKQHFVTRPTDDDGVSPWDIRLRRLTPDPDPVEATTLQNQSYWESYATLVNGSFTYDDTALISLYVDAFLFGANVGTRSYHVKGLIIDVPSNYDPIARTYSGIWDGSFKAAWTNNPAWIFWDLITNTRYGIGEFVTTSSVDKWSLYQIGQYCDQLVPSGFTNSLGNAIMEPRFTFNGVISTRQEAYKVLQQITSAFRGMAYWSLGQVFAAADMPSDPVAAITPANVVDGRFKYSGTAMKARHSVAVLTWNDPLDKWRDTPEVVQDDDQIRRFGWRQADVQLIGCTSRGQAHRFGKWLLDTERNQTETVQFTMSWDSYVLKDNMSLKPGDIVLVTDPRKNGNYRAGGRLAQVLAPSAVILDAPFEVDTAQSYTLSSMLPDGSFETRPIASFGTDNKTVTLATPFSAAPVHCADFIIQSTNMVARQYRIMAIQEDGANLFRVTALIHDPNKYARVEQQLALDPIQYVRPRDIVSVVTNISAVEARFFQNGVSHSRVTLSWTGPNDFSVSDYLVTADSPHGFVSYPAAVNPTLDFTDATPGDWTFYVTVRSLTGATSKPVSFNFTVEGWEAVDGPVPNNLRTTDGGTTFTGLSATLLWENQFPPNYVQYSVTNIVRVYDTTNTLLRTETVTQPSYTYDYDKNVNDGGPRRSFRIDVTALSVTGTESDVASIVVSNPAPAKTIPALKGDVGSIDVKWANTDSDYAGALVWASLSSGYVPNLNNVIYDGPDTETTLWLGAGKWYVWVALYDGFGKTGLNISDPQQLTISDLQSTLAAVVPALIEAKGGVTTDDIEEIGDQIAGLLSQVISDRDDNDELHKRSHQELAVQTTTMSALVAEETTARIEADFAEATARQVLEVTINTNIIAAIAEEKLVRASADEALTQITTLQQSQLATTNAAIATESTTRASETSAIASQYATLSTTVGTNTAGLSTLATSVDGVKVQYGVIGTINGTTGGFLFTGIKKLDGSVSYTLQIAGDVIVDGSVSAQKLNVINLSAITGNVGTLTAGKIRSTNGLVLFDLDNAYFLVSQL